MVINLVYFFKEVALVSLIWRDFLKFQFINFCCNFYHFLPTACFELLWVIFLFLKLCNQCEFFVFHMNACIAINFPLNIFLLCLISFDRSCLQSHFFPEISFISSLIFLSDQLICCLIVSCLISRCLS